MHFLPSLDQLLGLIGVLTVVAVFFVIGGAGARVSVPGGAQIIAGWGMATLVFMMAGVGTDLPLSWTFIAVASVAVALIVLYRGDIPGGSEIVRLLVLALPVAIAVAATHASQWDEFTNWLPNQRFLREFDRFPRSDLPPSLSVFPAYPFGLPLIGHFAGVTAGHFVENAGSIFNTLLIGVLASLLARQFALGLGLGEHAPPGWGVLALGILSATILNPTFVPKLVFTTYVDFTTAVVLAAMAWLLWRLAEDVIAGEPEERTRQLALQAGLAFAVLINLKQPNLLIGALAVAAAGVLVLLDGRVSLPTALNLLARVALPPVVVFGLWRFHVATQLTGGEFSFRPLADWIWVDAGLVAVQMLTVASKKGGYFALMAVITVVALRGLLTARTPLARLAIILATIFWGWNGFLYVSYLGSFSEGEGRAVASYWRYNTQLGGAAMLFAASAAAALWRRYVAWQPGVAASVFACALVLAAPALAFRAISFDRMPPKPFVRAAALEVAGLVPRGSVVGTVDPADNGEYMVFLRYALYRVGTVKFIGGLDWSSPEAIGRALADDRLTHLWVRGPRPAAAEALELPLAADSTYLLERTAGGWRIAKEWATTA